MKFSGFWVVLLSALVCSCSSVVHKVAFKGDSAPVVAALSGELILGRAYRPDELPEQELFALTPEMKAFATKAVAGIVALDTKAETLHRALMTSEYYGGRGIRYSAYTTNTGIDAFEQRRANCLSYTLLYVAMARHLGLPAEVNEVVLPPTWDMRNGDTYVFMRHVNAKVVLRRKRFSWVTDSSTLDVSDIVVDLELRRFRPHYKQQVIGNDLVAAQFYSNRAMELAAEGQPEQAFLHLRKALLMNDQQSYLWSNLGSLYQRLGFLPAAEALYLQGLSVNRQDYTIMHNLVGLYKATGNLERHSYYLDRVRKHRDANPYFIYRRAQEAFAKEQYPEALRLIKQAIKKEPEELRFYRLGTNVYDALGDIEGANKMRDKAYELTSHGF